MKKILLSLLFVLVAFLSFAPQQAQAKDNFFSRFTSRFNFHRNDDRHDDHGHKKHGRAPHRDDTIVSGTIFDGNHNPINGKTDGGTVTVTCNGNTKTSDIGKDGSYSVTFKKNKCDDGDSATATAVTKAGTGSKTSTVYDDPDEGPCGDADIAVIDITVPEFGIIGAGVTGMMSVAGYLYLRAKTIV